MRFPGRGSFRNVPEGGSAPEMLRMGFFNRSMITKRADFCKKKREEDSWEEFGYEDRKCRILLAKELGGLQFFKGNR
jgi:hypothetical protein